MDHRPSPNEVERIEESAKRQQQNELQASESVSEIKAAGLPQRNEKNQKHQPTMFE